MLTVCRDILISTFLTNITNHHLHQRQPCCQPEGQTANACVEFDCDEQQRDLNWSASLIRTAQFALRRRSRMSLEVLKCPYRLLAFLVLLLVAFNAVLSRTLLWFPSLSCILLFCSYPTAPRMTPVWGKLKRFCAQLPPPTPWRSARSSSAST